MVNPLIFVALVSSAFVLYGLYWKLFKEKDYARSHMTKPTVNINASLRTNEHHQSKSSDSTNPKLVVNIAGTAYDNDDGTSRQEILKHSKVGEKIILTHSPVSQDANAVKVALSNGKQVGWLHRSTAKVVASILDSGRKVDAEIEEISGGASLECRVAITNPNMIAEIKSGYDEQFLQQYDADKEAILQDYEKLTLREFMGKWGISSITWQKLKQRWAVKNKRGRSPNAV